MIGGALPIEAILGEIFHHGGIRRVGAGCPAVDCRLPEEPALGPGMRSGKRLFDGL